MGRKQLLVSDVMRIDAAVVAVTTSVEEADRVLRSTITTGLPVVDGDGSLVGVISHADLAAFRFARRKRPTQTAVGSPSARR